MTRPAKISLPYFDMLLRQLQQGNPDIEQAFGRHVHWGYWENPSQADRSAADFAAAAERLSQQVYQAAGVQSGNVILDAGCGFGGTIASLNENFADLQLVGLNIDPRQLERARRSVQPQRHNQIEFVEGDACQMPFADAAFDQVLAVECIFHFPSRATFFQEAWRVLRPGGQLAICDFVPQPWMKWGLDLWATLSGSMEAGGYGRVDLQFTLEDYEQLAQQTGFALTVNRDITANTLPTYAFLAQFAESLQGKETPPGATIGITTVMSWVSEWGWLNYRILSFTKPC